MAYHSSMGIDGPATFEDLMAQALVLDLEVTKERRQIKQIGAVVGEEVFYWQGGKDLSEALERLSAFGRSACYLIGHNLLHHDLPCLQAAAPDLALLSLPVIDTLFLSPLAFPRNPYHRLVKDYKLVRSSLSDPVADIRLAMTLFADEWESFKQRAAEDPDPLSFYAYCFDRAAFGSFGGQGLAACFRMMGAQGVGGDDQACAIFERLSGDAICRHTEAAVRQALSDAAHRPALAYALAWLCVAGANSVLPPWVRHQFPFMVPLLKTLRDTACGDEACGYCRGIHDPDRQLKRFFGFDGYRPLPASDSGGSLQRDIVQRGMQDLPLLAILPTGGGKSLCYQLPALVRHLRRGLLTVVISPLQALMKDQVDNLVKNTGTPFAAAIYGLLTPPERGEVIERVRLGDIALLYISPEQLRSRSVSRVLLQREIGCWVFDEAHCLSKWGHDFRPDYLYAARFIRELCESQGLDLPPVACFTATAKVDVIEEIEDYFLRELRMPLQLFKGGVERDNLHFNVLPVTGAEKLEQTHALVEQYLSEDEEAGIIVYAATRATTETIRDYLLQQGVAAEAFHGGLEAHDKRRIIDEFVDGGIPVICATNAFGMGIDKSNIRLVLHFDMPGSLENYLQEAGRAGRDMQPADCLLLYDPADAETQFKLGAMSEIDKEDIQHILRSLRRSKRNKQNEVVITTQELLRDEEAAAHFDKNDRGNDTKVRTAVSWLERARFLERNHNMTQVFQGAPLVKDLAAAEAVIDKAKVSDFTRELWRGIMQVLFNSRTAAGLSADDIAEQLFTAAARFRHLEETYGLTPAQLVIHSMHEMAAAGLLDKGMMLSAFVRARGPKSALNAFDAIGRLEERLLKLMQEEAPDTTVGEWVELDLSRLNQRLLNQDEQSNPVTLRNLIKGLTLDGKGLAGSFGSIDLRHLGRHRYAVALRRSMGAVTETAALRRSVAEVIVRHLVDKAKAATHGAAPFGEVPPSEGAQSERAENGSELLIQFSANELVDAIRGDLFLHARVQKPMAAVDRSLMFLHEHKIITLQHGLAVFRQAMTIQLNQDDRRRQYTQGDYKPLAQHYRERRLHVHVIVEYANLALEKVARALALVLDYFALPRDDFVKKHFADRKEILDRATSMESYRRIVESLANPIQIGIVGAPVAASQLVLAGPGSGKTTIIVHRCAYLLRVERVPAAHILVLCFNHSAAVAIRQRLRALVGNDAAGVTVATYHGAAMRLAGISLRELAQARTEGSRGFDFDNLIREAVDLLKGAKDVPGLAPDEVRDQLLAGFSHILVDEYQDIDEDQYNLVSAIAGRTLSEDDGRLAVTAVGDDDQNIYTFRGANVSYIKRFQKDYRCRTVYMVENYRSSRPIIDVANRLIARNQDRMKTDYPIRIDQARNSAAEDATVRQRDPVTMGRVQVLAVDGLAAQASGLAREVRRLKSLNAEAQWEQFAVLCRTKKTLDQIRAWFEREDIPLRLNLEAGLPLTRIREVHGFLTRLQAIEQEIKRASDLTAHLPSASGRSANPWTAMLAELHARYADETADAQLPVARLIDWLYEVVFALRREKSFGQGLFLSTIHSAKGLEFDHVFVADGDWRLPADRSRWEEERRLLYVAMTRARQSLCLMATEPDSNPLIGELASDALLRRQAPKTSADDAGSPTHRYAMLSPTDLFLSHAGRFPAHHTIHNHLAQLEPGDLVRLAARDQTIDILTASGVPVGQLSREGARRWGSRLSVICEVRVVALLQWTAQDGDATYQETIRVPNWEVPLLEVVLPGEETLPDSR